MLLMGAIDDPENKVVYFMSLDKIKFRRPVKPGDQIRFELEMQQIRGSGSSGSRTSRSTSRSSRGISPAIRSCRAC